MKKYYLSLAVGIFAVILILAVAIKRVATSPYRVSTSGLASQLASPEQFISLYELAMGIYTNNPNILLIDIRSFDAYRMGRLPGAISIPMDSLLHTANKEFIKPKPTKQTILYGDDEAHAIVAQAILLNAGYSGFRVLRGGYGIALKHIYESQNPSYWHYSDEKQKFNYGQLMPAGTNGSAGDNDPLVPDIPNTPRGGC